MKIHSKLYLFPILFVVFLVSGSCTFDHFQTEQELEKKPTLPLSQTPTQVPTTSKWWTQAPSSPTLAFEIQEQFILLLETNGGCDLPCFLGIMPGETSWEETKHLLEPFAVNPPLTPSEDHSTDTTKVVYAQVTTTAELKITFNITLYIEHDIVERIVIMTDGPSKNGQLDLYDQHLARYSLMKIIIKHGPPDIVYLVPPRVSIHMRAYGLYFLYEDEKIMFSLAGGGAENDHDGYTLCPNVGDGDISAMKFVLSNPLDKNDIRDYGLMVPFESSMSYPIEEALGMTIDEFYNLIVYDEPACFEVNDF